MAKVAGYSGAEWKQGAIAGAVCLVAVVVFFATGESSDEKAKRVLTRESHASASRVEETALRTCQRSIKSASIDPEKAAIPDVGKIRDGADYRFLWNQNSHMVRMRNGLGLEVAVGALCVVDEQTGRIKLLVLDGKQLIAPGS